MTFKPSYAIIEGTKLECQKIAFDGVKLVLLFPVEEAN